MLLCQGQSFGFGFPVGDEPCCMVMKRVTVCIHPLFFCEFRSRREFGFGFVCVFGAGVDALGLLWVVAAANAQKRTQHHINTSRLAETKLHTGRHTTTNNNKTSAQSLPQPQPADANTISRCSSPACSSHIRAIVRFWKTSVFVPRHDHTHATKTSSAVEDFRTDVVRFASIPVI